MLGRRALSCLLCFLVAMQWIGLCHTLLWVVLCHHRPKATWSENYDLQPLKPFLLVNSLSQAFCHRHTAQKAAQLWAFELTFFCVSSSAPNLLLTCSYLYVRFYLKGSVEELCRAGAAVSNIQMRKLRPRLIRGHTELRPSLPNSWPNSVVGQDSCRFQVFFDSE